jgi:hypothetical protein
MKCVAGRAGPGGPTTHRPPLGGSAAYVYAAVVIGLAIVGTVAWSAVASTRRSAAAAAAAAAQAGAHLPAGQAAAVLTDFNQPSAHHQVLDRQRQPTSPPQDQRQSDGTARLGESNADHEPSRMPPAGSDGRVDTAALMTVAA